VALPSDRTPKLPVELVKIKVLRGVLSLNYVSADTVGQRYLGAVKVSLTVAGAKSAP
jgi:hypothetical protein